MKVRKELAAVVERNLERKKEKDSGAATQDSQQEMEKTKSNRLQESVLDYVVDMREYGISNASYSPNFNPIEGVIGLAKLQIKRKRW